ncbi:MAG TPA: histidine phosphatase family protein [Bacillota bacterium]|nr:histidine phosphatase family protein [Bacillota bacterium]
MTTVYLIRHGQTLANREGILQGHLDAPLSEYGKRQAELVGKALSTANIDTIYSSDLDRARKTAEAIAKYHDLEPILDPRLREIHCGSLQGKTMEESKRLYPEFFESLKEDPLNTPRPGGGESYIDLHQRSVDAFEDILKKHPESNVVIVTHGGVVRCLLAYAQGMLPDPSSPTPDNASISVISFKDGKLQVEKINDISHLAELYEEMSPSSQKDTYRWLN